MPRSDLHQIPYLVFLNYGFVELWNIPLGNKPKFVQPVKLYYWNDHMWNVIIVWVIQNHKNRSLFNFIKLTDFKEVFQIEMVVFLFK